jgi:pilus assembly protein CpaE
MHHADEILIVATPDLATLRNCKNLLQAVKSRRPNDAAPKVIINQVGVPKRKEVPLKAFGDTIGQEPELVLNFEPPLFGLAANNGQMLGEVQPKSRAAEAMHQLAKTITGRQAKPAAKAGAFSLSLLGLKSA